MPPASHEAPGWLTRLSLRRIITSNRFIPEIDGFRFLAILMVVLTHILVQCGRSIGDLGLAGRLFVRAFQYGNRGVFLFFAISGFILALPFARHHLLGTKPVALGSYFRRRLTRLEPPYILAMVLRTFALSGAKQLGAATLAAHLAASLLYIHNAVYNSFSIINPPAWSLEIEVQFYILAPLLTAIFMVRSPLVRRGVIVAVILLSALAATYLIPPSSRLFLSLLEYFHYFAAGFLLCDLYLTGTRFSLPPWVWDLIGAAALLWILFYESDLYYVLLPFVTIALYMAGFNGRAVRAVFAHPVLSTIGGMCYSLYLTHSTVLAVAERLLTGLGVFSLSPAAQTVILYPVCMLGILAVGTIFFVLVERPCMDPNWPQKLAQRFSSSRERVT